MHAPRDDFAPAQARRALIRWGVALAGVAALQLSCFAVLPWIRAPMWAVSPVAFALVGAVVLTVGAFVPPVPLRALAALVLPVGALAWVGTVQSGPHSPGAVTLVTISLLAGGTLIGGAVAARVDKAEYLLLIAYISSVADLYSVLAPSGMTGKVVESERMLSLLALSWPLPAGPGHEAVGMPLLGVGDVIMASLYLVVARRFRLGLARTLVALGLAFLAVETLLVALRRPLPALPLLGLAMVLAHAPARRLPPGEGRVAVGGMAAVTILFAALWGLGAT